MYSFVTTFVLLFCVSNRGFSQSLFQEPGLPSINLSVDADLEQFTPFFGGLPLNDTSNGGPQCFVDIAGLPHFRPVARADCFMLFYTILVRPSAATPYQWDAKIEHRTKYFKYGACTISIYPTSSTSRDTFTELGIARVAALVVRDCVTAPRSYLGGRLRIGNSLSYWVAIGGH